MIVLVVATRSRDKFEEIRSVVPSGSPLRLIDLDEAGIEPSPAEDGIEAFSSFEENALAKARYFRALGLEHVLGDDSGLCVEALGGAPGVLSKRFSGRSELSGRALDRANNAHLLQRLSGVAAPRLAHYVCVLALSSAAAGDLCFRGEVHGEILTAERGTNGFGYDPLFYVPQLGRTFGEVEAEVKNRISHRARATRAALPTLLQLR